MTTYLAKTVSKRIFKEHAGNHFGAGDPYFDYVPVLDRHGNPTSKTKKVKKAVPAGISDADAKILSKVTRRSYRLDNNFSFCGIKFGLSAIVGLVPFIGDFFDMFMALMVLHTAEKAKLSKSVRSKMVMNIFVDCVIGFVPFLGDVADALFKANTRNTWLLYELLEERGKANIAAREKMLGHSQQVQQPTVNKPIRQNTEYPTDVIDQRPPPHYDTVAERPNTVIRPDPTRPQAAKITKAKSGTLGWLNRFASNRNDDTDLERGENDVPAQPPRPQR